MFHTRQQHTLKVAQVGRRLAQQCISKQPDASEKFGLDAEVLEAACLAHDLGHPPFGHVGEHVLHERVLAHGDLDGFEGNAQTFRIVTKLAVRFLEHPGLDLTQATLAATIKYPWFRDPADETKNKKWGAYRTEVQDFEFARSSFDHEAKTTEAALMDWADDIAYSVHDLEDFHRCGALPWHRIFEDNGKRRLIGGAVKAWFGAPGDASERLSAAFGNLYELIDGISAELFSVPYEGSRDQRQQLRTLTSKLIGRYIRAAKLKAPDEVDTDGSTVSIDPCMADEVRVLKQITRDYIIENPTLAAQQKGQTKILENLYEAISADAQIGPPRYIPQRLVYLWDAKTTSPARFVADCIASLTEAEVIALHGRLQGTSSGSVLDPIVR